VPISKNFRLCLITTTILSTPFLARADDLAPQMTVTATQVPTLLPDVPAGVTVITQQQIQQRGYTTLVQALAAVPGLGVVQSGGPGGQASVFIRGTNSEDVLVLIDGVPANDPSISSGAYNFGEDNLADIARIEVVRGPMSGLYGGGAVGGVINIITVQGQGKPRVSVTAAGGFPAQGQGGVTVSGATGKFDYALSASVDQEAGFDYTARRLSVYNGQRDPFRENEGSVNFGYTPVAGTRMYLVLRARETDSANPDLGSPIYDDPNNYTYDRNFLGKLGVKSDLLNGLLTTEFFVARVQDDRRYSNLNDYPSDPGAASADDHYHGARTDVQWNNTVHVPDTGPAALSSLLFGVEYLNDNAKQRLNDGSVYVYDNVVYPSVYQASVNASQHSIAGHAALQTTLYNRLTLTAALRDDAVSSFGSAVTGRAGAVFAMPEIFAHLKASYGTGFIAPSLFDLYGVDSYGYVGNPNLKPEYSKGYEAGVQFDIPACGRADFISLSSTYFDTNIRNFITTVYSPVYTEANVYKARISGVENDVVFTPATWLSAEFTYTYTDARTADLSESNNGQLLRRPENTGSASIAITPIAQLTITPQVQYTGKFSDVLYDNNGNFLGDGTAKPGTVVNLAITYLLRPQLTLFAQGKNLFQSRFEPVNGLQIPGQSFLFGVRATIQ
jgi:vitamin B12 transporter